MRVILGLAWSALVAGWADGRSGDERPVALDWERSPYVVGPTERAVGAAVVLGGPSLPPGATLEVRATQGGVLVDPTATRTDGPARIAVTMRPEADARGAYVVTARIVVGGVVHEATTMVVVTD